MKNNDNKKKIELSIIIIVIAVFMVLISLAMRKASYTQTWLVCNMDRTNQFHETIKFRFDADDNMYGYYREEKYYNMSNDILEVNYQEKQAEAERVSSEMSDNFRYDVTKSDTELLVKTYIGVSVYPNFFNKYIDTDKINNNSKIEDVKAFLEQNDFTCEVSRK